MDENTTNKTRPEKAGYIFCIAIGFCMLGIWVMLLMTGQVKEIADEPFRIAAHLFSEAITAVSLIVGGVIPLRHPGQRDKLHLVSLGMLMYSVLTASGYYLQLDNMVMALMFALIFVTAAMIVIIHLRRIGA